MLDPRAQGCPGQSNVTLSQRKQTHYSGLQSWADISPKNPYRWPISHETIFSIICRQGNANQRPEKSHFIHITVAKNRKNIETGRIYTNTEKPESPTLLLECKGARTLWKTWHSSSNVKRGVTIWLRYLLKRLETFSYKTCTWMLRLALPTIAQKQEHPRGLSTGEETSERLYSHVMDLYLTTRGNEILEHGNSSYLESIIQ